MKEEKVIRIGLQQFDFGNNIPICAVSIDSQTENPNIHFSDACISLFKAGLSRKDIGEMLCLLGLELQKDKNQFTVGSAE